jgi:CO/xanthine dehydrogenase Mo-binding subunit
MAEQYIGRSLPRTDAYAKVTGQAIYPGDLSMDGMVHMKMLFAGRAHARIIYIDTSRAAALSGVLAVLTAEDVPVNSYGMAHPDQPVMCRDVIRFVGDRIALIVAETIELAEYARDLIHVEYEDLPIVDSPDAALAPGAPFLHAGKPDNILSSYRVRKGDVAAGFAEAEVIVEQTYTVGAQEHAYLQPDAGLAWLDDDGCLVVISAGQWVHDDRRQIARSLDLPEEQVRVQYAAIGGAFGGREDVTVHIPLALAALRTGRPVKIVWDREETTIGHPKRHAMRIHHRWGARGDGKLLAQDSEIIADAGAYASTSDYVLATTVLLSTGPYDIPNVSIDAKAVYTNNITGGAFRGFGAPQAVFAAELQMARLAEALQIDPVELRLRNFLDEGSLTSTMAEVPPGISAMETLKATARRLGWRSEPDGWQRPKVKQEKQSNMRQGIGIASGWKTVGFTFGWPDEATATIELYGEAHIERVVVRMPVAEMGQGVHTVIRQMSAEALAVPFEIIELGAVDTADGPSAGAASASRLVLMGGNAIRGAADVALARWQEEDRPAVGAYTFRAPPTEDLDPLTGQGTAAYALAYLAQGVEVEVDLETGHVFVRRLISAHDVGKAINPQLVEGQIEGGAVQGLGWATMENFITQKGIALTPTMSTYLIPTIADIPLEFEAIILEEELPLGPWGATGIGEMSLVALAPAIVDAIHEATGVWCNQIPLTPERVFWSLKGSDQSTF